MALTVNLTLRTPKQQPAQTLHLTAGYRCARCKLEHDLRGPSAILSPDGTRLVVLLAAEAGSGPNPASTCAHWISISGHRAISGTEGASGPFFSPNGQWIGFFAQGTLKKILSVQGGPAIPLCDARNDLGGSWGEDDTIVFAASPSPGAALPLFKVSSAGGTPQPRPPPLDPRSRASPRSAGPRCCTGVRLYCSAPRISPSAPPEERRYRRVLSVLPPTRDSTARWILCSLCSERPYCLCA